MLRSWLALLLSFVVVQSTAAAPQHVIATGGVDGIELGMNPAQAARQFHASLKPPAMVFGPECYVTESVDQDHRGFQFTFEQDHLVRIDLSPSGAQVAEARTLFGIGLGSSKGDVSNAYGASLVTTVARYFDEETPDAPHEMRLRSKDERSGIIFVIEKDAVTHIMVGTKQMLNNLEPCL